MEIDFYKEVNIPFGDIHLKGDLFLPKYVEAVIVFSHGSGSSRMSSRNRMVAKYLQEKKYGILLFDLLTLEEDKKYANRFKINLLTRRLIGATHWLEKQLADENCRIGYFGASTGAASALEAAAQLPQITAIVSRGGRPDLAMKDLYKVKAPTLLLVGSLDYDVLQLNVAAFNKLNCIKKLSVIQGATHLFEEPGTMQQVCEHASEWFETHLTPASVIN